MTDPNLFEGAVSPRNPDEPLDARLKRMKIRAWRRGTKEMDLILGPFADRNLASMDAPALDLFDELLHENDQDLYQWVSGQKTAPERFKDLIATLSQRQ